MSDVTRVLTAIERGDPAAGEQLLPLVYEELRKLAAQNMAREAPGQTLQATALVHEAYLRLVNVQGGGDFGGTGPAGGPGAGAWNGRGHFFAAAAEAMRRILINRARDKKRLKRGGGWTRVSLEQLERADDASDDDLLAVDEALAALARHNQTCADLIKLRFFAGLTLAEAATSLGLPRRTADRHWAYARAWMYDAMTGSGAGAARPGDSQMP